MKKSAQLILCFSVVMIVILSGCPSLGGGSQTDARSDTITPNKELITSDSPAESISTTDAATSRGKLTSTKTERDTTRTEISTPVETLTPSEPTSSYREFAIVFNDGLQTNAEIPLRIHAYGSRNGTWYVVINATAPSLNKSRHNTEWVQLANSYASAFVFWERDDRSGDVPKEMVVLD